MEVKPLWSYQYVYLYIYIVYCNYLSKLKAENDFLTLKVFVSIYSLTQTTLKKEKKSLWKHLNF